MKQDILYRVTEEAYYIAETGATVRKTAEIFGVGKSTVHKDVTERLFNIDKELFEVVKKILEVNLLERHIRGGEATKQKFLRLKDKSLKLS